MTGWKFVPQQSVLLAFQSFCPSRFYLRTYIHVFSSRLSGHFGEMWLLNSQARHIYVILVAALNSKTCL
jgi:hypothetical protein